MPLTEQTPVFDTRFQRHETELKQIYEGLYHDQQAYSYFVGMLRRMWKTRNEHLRLLDEQRERNAKWYRGRDLVGMLMYVDAFAGTLSGVREKLLNNLNSDQNLI